MNDGGVLENSGKDIDMTMDTSFTIPFSPLHTNTFLIGCAKTGDADTNEHVPRLRRKDGILIDNQTLCFNTRTMILIFLLPTKNTWQMCRCFTLVEIMRKW